MTPAEASAWSPLTASQHACPLRVIAFGAEETTPFLEPAAEFQSRLNTQGEAAQLLPLPGLNHMTVVLDLADPLGLAGGRIADMVASS